MQKPHDIILIRGLDCSRHGDTAVQALLVKHRERAPQEYDVGFNEEIAMFNSISIADQAFYLSRMIYRDTKIEYYHADSVVLGMEVYDDMLKVVDQNIKMVQRYHPKMLSIQTEEDVDVQLSSMPSSERDEFKQYVFAFAYLSKSACNWDPPQILELPTLPEDLSQFVLSGHFIECCREHRALTDPTMRYINKDIYNRIYTLMRENLLP